MKRFEVITIIETEDSQSLDGNFPVDEKIISQDVEMALETQLGDYVIKIESKVQEMK